MPGVRIAVVIGQASCGAFVTRCRFAVVVNVGVVATECSAKDNVGVGFVRHRSTGLTGLGTQYRQAQTM
mgnify:CR=1 FL=1